MGDGHFAKLFFGVDGIMVCRFEDVQLFEGNDQGVVIFSGFKMDNDAFLPKFDEADIFFVLQTSARCYR